MAKYFAPAFHRQEAFVVDDTPHTMRQVVFASLRTLYERGDDFFFQQAEKFAAAGYGRDVEIALKHL